MNEHKRNSSFERLLILGTLWLLVAVQYEYGTPIRSAFCMVAGAILTLAVLRKVGALE